MVYNVHRKVLLLCKKEIRVIGENILVQPDPISKGQRQRGCHDMCLDLMVKKQHKARKHKQKMFRNSTNHLKTET